MFFSKWNDLLRHESIRRFLQGNSQDLKSLSGLQSMPKLGTKKHVSGKSMKICKMNQNYINIDCSVTMFDCQRVRSMIKEWNGAIRREVSMTHMAQFQGMSPQIHCSFGYGSKFGTNGTTKIGCLYSIQWEFQSRMAFSGSRCSCQCSFFMVPCGW